MIRSFRDEATQKAYSGERVKAFASIARVAQRKLVYLDAASDLRDFASAGYRLEALHGDRKGQYSIRVTGQYRICFRWIAPDAYDVELVDYH